MDARLELTMGRNCTHTLDTCQQMPVVLAFPLVMNVCRCVCVFAHMLFILVDWAALTNSKQNGSFSGL